MSQPSEPASNAAATPPDEVPNVEPSSASGRKKLQPSWVLWALLILGLVASLGLEYVHWAAYYRPAANSFCSVGANFDCDAVAASSWSTFAGVPWAVWGAVGYATMLWAYFKRSALLVPLAAMAALVSLLLLGISLFAVRSICLLCEVTHITSFLFFALILRNRDVLRADKLSIGGALDVLLAPLGLALSLIFFFPSYWDAFSFKGEPPFAVGVTEEGYPWIGAEEPKLTIHEFVDYSCGHCKVHAAHTLRALRRHPEIRVVRRQQPRMRCLDALSGSCSHVRMAYCAEEQGKFWQADRWLFAHAKSGLVEPDVAGMARDLALDQDSLDKCVRDARTYERARREAKITNKAKIRSIPAYMIDGKRVKPAEVNQLLR